MTTEKPQKCALGICPDHPRTMERVAILEQAFRDMKGVNDGVLKRLDLIRDMTMKELEEQRKFLQKAVLDRYSTGVVITFSIITGLLGIFATGLITLLITHYLP